MADSLGWAAGCVVALAGLVVVSRAALAGWRDWIALQRLRLEGRRTSEGGAPAAASRIELADLRERIRKLEAIAAGLDL